jgi:hypothetical protein
MSKLQKSLNEWVSHKFIDERQAKLILEHESAKTPPNWVLSGFLILGAVIIGIGLISVIASNWNNIPPLMRLAGNFVSLCALAFAVVRSWEREKPIQFEALLLCFLILCLASIGLIAQIFHTGGSLYQALLFWAVITFLPVLASRYLFIPLLWIGSLMAVIFIAAVDSSVLRAIYSGYDVRILFAVPLLCACMAAFGKTVAGEVALTRAARVWLILTGLAGLIAGELDGAKRGHRSAAGMSEWIDPRNVGDKWLSLLAGQVLAAVVLFLILRHAGYRKIQKVVLVLVLLAYVALFHLPLIHVTQSAVYAGVVITILGLFATFMASLREMWIFHFLLILMGLRFLILYFQALGGLATTGFGLMAAGALIIGMAYLWHKYRNTISARAEEWTR